MGRCCVRCRRGSRRFSRRDPQSVTSATLTRGAPLYLHSSTAFWVSSCLLPFVAVPANRSHRARRQFDTSHVPYSARSGTAACRAGRSAPLAERPQLRPAIDRPKRGDGPQAAGRGWCRGSAIRGIRHRRPFPPDCANHFPTLQLMRARSLETASRHTATSDFSGRRPRSPRCEGDAFHEIRTK